jgi:hypothetical protein
VNLNDISSPGEGVSSSCLGRVGSQSVPSESFAQFCRCAPLLAIPLLKLLSWQLGVPLGGCAVLRRDHYSRCGVVSIVFVSEFHTSSLGGY